VTIFANCLSVDSLFHDLPISVVKQHGRPLRSGRPIIETGKNECVEASDFRMVSAEAPCGAGPTRDPLRR
jgi:hypothetical protein